MNSRLVVKFVAILCAGAAFGQASTAQTEDAATTNKDSAVAYVYVLQPADTVYGFSVSSSGELTAVPGSPFANVPVSSLSVTKKHLFGPGNDGENIYSFAIGANGAIKSIGQTNAQKYNPNNCGGFGLTALDRSGSTLYNLVNFQCEIGVQSFKIGSNGELGYLGTADSGLQSNVVELGQLSFLGTDKFAFQSGCSSTAGILARYKRQSNGLLVSDGTIETFPTPKNANDFYCPVAVAADNSHHLAIDLFELDDLGDQFPPSLIGSFIGNSDGNLITKSTYENMPPTGVESVVAMSISPSNKLLAVGGQGFQVFHFDGGNQVTNFSSVQQVNDGFLQFGWDNANHLYAQSLGALYVYTVTSTSIEEAPGSPYSIPESSSVAVLPLN